MFTSSNNIPSLDKTKKNSLLTSKADVSFNFFTYLINEYANFSFTRKKDNSIENLGEDVGARLYEGLLFNDANITARKGERKIKILDILNYIKQELWTEMFGKPASGLESFIGERKHEKTGNELKEYVVYDINPPYNLRYSKENFAFKFFAGILKGFLSYAGFPCKVINMIGENNRGGVKCEFVIFFDEKVFDRE